jgi:glucose/arabinose dehydrogenase
MKRIRRTVTVLCAVLSALCVRTLDAQTLPPNFIEDIIASDLTLPIGFSRLPDGRVLIAEKAGVVRLLKNGVLQPAPFIDLRTRVNDYWDRGMLGIAADPNFASNGFVYLYYVFENNSADYSGPKTARLTRVTAAGDTASPSTEVVLLGSQSGPSCGGFPAGSDCIPADSPSHNGGSIRFASDGTMYVTTGDGASFNVVDDLALRAQDLGSLAGKVLHITTSGNGISTNPDWTGNAADVRSKVWAYGLRNPFRMSLRPGTNQVYVADVGWSAYEEVNVGLRGANLGWPCYEGPGRQGGYESKATCQTLYAAGPSAVQMPLTSYAHDNASAAVVGGPFYNGTAYPTQYRGAYFFADYARGWIQFLNVDASNNLVSGPTTFGTDLPGPVDMQVFPDEQIYYLAINTGDLRRIRYVGTSETLYASDTNWLSAVNGWGPVERDMSNGEASVGDGHPLTIGGVSYIKGLGVHAYSEIRYQLDGICTVFSAVVGVDDEVGDSGSVVFALYGDGTQIFGSGVLTGSAQGLPVSLPLYGVNELALIVTDAGDGPAFDHADWADLKLTCGGSSGTQFGAPVSLAARTNTHSVTAVDLNADGRPDLVAANAGDHVASVWLGNGDATFGTRADFATGPTPKSIAVGDLNRDGKPDLVSANQDGASVSVLLGNGTGGFGAAVNYPACSGTHEVAIGDFNRDNSVDLLVACWGGSVVSYLRGNGNGTFAAMVNYTVGAAPHSIVARDFNGDGTLDAAVANHDEASVSVLIGRGDGTFNAHVRYQVGGGPHSVRAGDVDGDGILDLAIANDASDTISVLRGRPDGTFIAAVNYPTGQVPKGVAIADIDGDGLADLLSANTAGNYPTCCNPGGDTISLLLNAGGGSFAAAQTYTVGTTPFAVSTGDLDGDGDLDVLTANWHSNDVTVLRNDGVVDPPPQLTGIAAGNIANTSAVISWQTNEPADTQVEYGPDPRYGFNSPLQTTRTTAHQVTLSGLIASTLYHYRVKSRDSAGNLAVSDDFTFTTTGSSAPIVYLSDLFWTSMTNGWGPIERDRSNGEAGTADGTIITLNGVTYQKGLGAHAASEVVYAIPSGCSQFFAAVGVDDEVGAQGRVQFQAWADSSLLFQSAALTGNSATVSVAVTLAGQNQLRLVVTDGADGVSHDHADWAGARFLCGAVNNPPTPVIASPAVGTLFKVGDVITYSGSATDTEDGALPPSSLEWTITLYHCPAGDCHVHPFLHATGSSGSFTVPDHGDNFYVELTLWATDNGGATSTTSRIINPQTGQVTLNTNPSGLQLVYGGTTVTAPFTTTSIVGSTQTVSAPSPQGGNTFISWSDGGAQQHNITVGASNMTLVATFGSGGSSGTYLSDLAWTSMTNGWGPVERDRSNGELGASDGGVLTLNGATYAKGLGAHAFSDVRVGLNGTCSTFTATVGVDDEVGALGSVVFQVLADGVLRYDSGPMTGTTASQNVSVSVTGAAELALIVTDAGDGVAYDHADWADARVVCSSGGGASAPTITTMSPAAGATNVQANSNVRATFSEAMNAATINTSTFFLRQGTTSIPSAVSYDSTTLTATLNPNSSLAPVTTYTVTVRGGSGGVKDLAGNPLASDFVRSFTTR